MASKVGRLCRRFGLPLELWTKIPNRVLQRVSNWFTSSYNPNDAFPHIPSYCLDNGSLTDDFVHGVALLFYFHVQDEDKIRALLWNPCIDKHMVLPWTTVMPHGSIVGLGFDSGKNDFKVVRSDGSSYDVLTLREGAWKTDLQLPPGLLGMRYQGTGSCFLNDNIHWIVQSQHGRGDCELLMFDCGSEDFKTAAFPRSLISDGPPELMLLDLGTGSMLAVAKIVSLQSKTCEVWVMENYGGEWSRLDCDHPTFGGVTAAEGVATAANNRVFRNLGGLSKLHHSSKA